MSDADPITLIPMTRLGTPPTLRLAVALLLPLACSCVLAGSGEDFDVVEATIPEMQLAMQEGRVTSRELVESYLLRIAMYEERVNAAISINANALSEADRLDRERAEGRVRGPLHGIPVALKDNMHTTDMPTTGGALAFEGYIPPYEATLTMNLREAGAIILAKTAGFAEAWRNVAAERLARFEPDHVLLSYHGLPERQVTVSDTHGHCLASPDCCDAPDVARRGCYRAQCFATTRALLEALRLDPDRTSTSFQSRLGRTPWIEPHTIAVLPQLHAAGVPSGQPRIRDSAVCLDV